MGYGPEQVKLLSNNADLGACETAERKTEELKTQLSRKEIPAVKVFWLYQVD